MPYTYTRTHTVYFDDDSLAELDAAIAAVRSARDHLGADWTARGRHLANELAEAGISRLALLGAAVDTLDTARTLLAEPVADALS